MRIMIIDSPEGELYADGIRLRAEEPYECAQLHTLAYAPLCGKECYFPRSYRFLQGDPCRSENPEVLVTRCGADDYLLKLAPEPFTRYEYPEPLLSVRFRSGGADHTATLLRGNGYLLVIECENYFYRFPLPSGAGQAELDEQEGLVRLKYVLDGETYQLLVGFFGDYAELFHGRADTLDISGSEVSIVRSYCDNLGHMRMDVYRRENGRLVFVKSRFRHTKEPRKSAPETLLPYLFLEAVVAGDYAECRTYLHADCPLDPADIADFFGLPLEVRQNPFDGLPALFFRDEAARFRLQSYRFELSGEKILNITEC